jgi:hypothetical protein
MNKKKIINCNVVALKNKKNKNGKKSFKFFPWIFEKEKLLSQFKSNRTNPS